MPPQRENNGSVLNQMDGEIDSMEETLSSLQTSLQTRIIQRKRERNSLIRFHQLPLEIASNILWLSIADPWKRKMSCSFLHRLRTISSVCSSWRTLVEGSPRFWSIIEFKAAHRAILTLLEKSKSSALEIKCFSEGGYECMPVLDRIRQSATCLESIAPHAHRIRSLVLSMPTTNGIIALLSKPAPMLEELKLQVVHCLFVEPLELFCGQAGRLRDVVLENIPVRWDSEAMRGLRSLRIKGQFVCSPLKMQVMPLLERNPGLESLDLEDLAVMEIPGVDMVGGSARPSRVVMSKLRELRLSSLPFELVEVILGGVDIPSIETFDLKCVFRGQPASRILGPNLKHLVPHLLTRSKGTELAEITFGESSVGLSVNLPWHKTPPIQIQLHSTIPVSGFEWIADTFFSTSPSPSSSTSPNSLPAVGAPDIFQVSLKFGNNFDMRSGSFVPVLDRLSAVKVKSLTIESGCIRGDELIKYIGATKDDFQWPLPHLMSLTIAGSPYLASDLSVALKRRKTGDLSKEIPPEAATSLPVPLEVLDIEGLRGVDKKVEKTLAKYVSASGTFIRASRQRLTYWDGNGDDWEDFDEDPAGYDEDIYNTYGPLAMVSPYVW